MQYDDNIPWEKRLQLERCRMGLTQKEIATQISSSVRSYQRWELGINLPSQRYRKLIAAVCGVDSVDIFGK